MNWMLIYLIAVITIYVCARLFYFVMGLNWTGSVRYRAIILSLFFIFLVPSVIVIISSMSVEERLEKKEGWNKKVWI